MVFIFGAIIGSFLNVVIYRLPIILSQQWRQECLEYLKQNITNEPNKIAKFNLMYPRSHCTNCSKLIAWWQNIPLLSYLFLGAKCYYCKKLINLRYPLIELLCAIASCWLVFHFGLTWQAAISIIFSYLLIVMIFIDLDHMIIPDQLNFSLLWLALLANCFYIFTNPISAIIGAIAGYSFLWSIMILYKLVTGKVGMGHGDFKLFAALGACFGWQLLPLTLLIAAFLGSVVGISLILCKQHQREKPLPFGPYLAIAGWISLLWGNQIMAWYFNITGVF
jgi:leader peptidase (prepilin peptidase)/N-methyltransferase